MSTVLKLIDACKNGHSEVLKYLVELGCDPTVDNNYAILLLSYTGNLEVVKYLLGLGCDPTAENNWAIGFASRNGRLEVVKYLVSVGCDPKADNNWAIQIASENGHLDVVKYLLGLGCDHKTVKKLIKYEALQKCKINLLTFMQTVRNNKYLKIDILKIWFPQFTEFEIINML